MTAQDAIKELDQAAIAAEHSRCEKRATALRLGIEALRQWIEGREGMSLDDVWLLKGETRE